MRSRGVTARLAAALLGVTAVAEAAGPDPTADGHADVPVAPPTSAADAARRVEFRADRVELEPGKERLELRGDVDVSVDRYRLRSEHLSLERGPRGIVVKGSGRVALCPCPNPPVTFGFQSATIAPPTDLLLADPTVRILDVPVFWLPYLWLRAPSRPGLLPLRVAYRGDDGFLLGSGVHLPLSDRTALDVGLGGYLRGGAEADVRLATERTTTEVAWDYFRTGAIRADLRGSARPVDGSAVAWSLDALRGARAETGPSQLEEVALRQDRARAFAGFAGSGGVIGLVASAAAVRGGPLGAVDAAGPGAIAGFGAALGDSASFDTDVGITTLHQRNDDATSLVTQRAELRTDALAGPVVVDGEARTRALATLGPLAAGHTVATGIDVSLSLPLVKTFGSSEVPVQHWIVPFVEGLAGGSDTSAPSVTPALVRDGLFHAASAGIRSTVGETAGHRSALSVSARVGEVGEGEREPQAMVAWTARASAPYAALSSEGASSVSGLGGSWLTSRARVGREDGPNVGGHVVTTTGLAPVAGRLLSGGWDAPWIPWLERNGWSVGGRAGVPWTHWLASAVDADYDVTNRTWLSVRGTLAYRHPCGCLALTLWGGHRLGRASIDSWLTVDLVR